MKEINKKVFLIVLIFALISIVMTSIFFNNLIGKITDASLESKQELKNIVEDGNVEDVEGHAAIFYGSIYGLGAFGIFMYKILQSALIAIIILYMVLYLSSFLIHNKKESKARIVISGILNIVAILLKIIYIYILIELFLKNGFTDMELLLGISVIIEIISIVTILIYYILNRKQILKVYKGEVE